jgi:hypothetical protein
MATVAIALVKAGSYCDGVYSLESAAIDGR